MKKRILSILLSLAMFISIMPMSVFATETEAPQPATCSCETKCTAEAITAECALCGAENADLAVCTGAEPQQEEPIAQPLTQPAPQQDEGQQQSTSYAVVYVSAEHGTFKVMVDGAEIASGTTVESGKKVTIVAAPADGYYVDSVKYNNSGAYWYAENTYTFQMPTEAVDLNVTFLEEIYPVSIGGVFFTGTDVVINSTDLPGIVTEGSAKLTVGKDEYGDPTFTLTLDDFKYNGEGGSTGQWASTGYNEYYAVITSYCNLNIVLEGENSITVTDNDELTVGIFTGNNDLIISGSATSLVNDGEQKYDLTINSTYDGTKAGNIVFENCSVKATTTYEEACGIGARSSISVKNAVTDSYGYIGLSAPYVEILNSDVTATGVVGGIVNMVYPGIYAKNTNIINSKVTAKGVAHAFYVEPTIDDNYSFVIYAGDNENAGQVDNIANHYGEKYVRIEPIIKYPVWVGGVQFTSANTVIDSTDNDNITDGTATLIVNVEEKGDYAVQTFTLELDSFTYIEETPITSGSDDMDDDAAIVSDVPLDIVVKGTNTISGTNCISAYNNLNIKGQDKNNDKLIINYSGAENAWGMGIMADGKAKFADVNISITATNEYCGLAIGILNSFKTSNTIIDVKTNESQIMSMGGILAYEKIKFKDSKVTVNWDTDNNSEALWNAAIVTTHKMIIEDSEVYAKSTGNSGSYGIAWNMEPVSSGGPDFDISESAYISVKNSKVTAIGTTAAYNCKVSNLDGSLDNLVVYAGNSAENAEEEDKGKEETYTNNKYVKIAPKPAATPTPAPTEKPTVTPTPEPTVAPTATPTPAPTAKPTATPEPTAEPEGEVVVKDKDGVLGFGGVLVQTAEELTEILVSEEDKALLDKGHDIIIFLENTDISTSVTEEEKQLIAEAVSGVENAQVGVYLDINLFKQVGDNSPEKITNTNKPIVISVEIPQQLIPTDENVQRTYYIVRVHDGQTDIIEGKFDAATGIFTFETDKFSTYTIIYTDVVTQTAEPTPAPQQTSFPWWIVVAAVAVAVVVVVVKKKHDEE